MENIMIKKVVIGAAFVLVMVGIAAPDASAVCPTPKSAGNYNTDTSTGAIWHSTLAGTPGATLVGKLWSGSTDVTGNCNTACTGCGAGHTGFLYFNGSDIGFNIQLADSCLPTAASACPIGTLTVAVSVSNTAGNSEFMVTQANEVSGGANAFDFSTFNHTLVPDARPRVTNSTKAGAIVNLSLGVDARNAGPSNGLFEGSASSITGYNVLRANGVADPGGNAAAYQPFSPAVFIATPNGNPGSTSTSVDCAGVPALQDVWIATQLVTTAGPSTFVGERTRVKCNSALADPKFKIVPKKKSSLENQPN